MSDGTRTHDRLDHNQELYQLSYAHRGTIESTIGRTKARLPGWARCSSGRELGEDARIVAGAATAGTAGVAGGPVRKSYDLRTNPLASRLMPELTCGE